ncbi:MAG: tripartite tricarboxylate transporter substrate binding protein [Alphaproteobacteria bacterium]|nr:tripartite tricarboxylate transporter substrate binding protein [Alphaproteobacteria bacterium]
MKTTWSAVCAIASLLASAALVLSSSASEFPERAVEITVTFPPGGTPDVLARALSEGMSAELKQPFVVLNKLGAAGMVGATAVSRAKPDGHSLLFAPALVQSVAPLINVNPDYKPDGLVPICQAFETQMALVVKPDSPYKTVGDIIDAARAKPGVVTYRHAGIGSIPQLAMIELANAAKVEFNAIPYKGDADVPGPVLGGIIDFGPMTLSAVPVGAVRIVAIFADKRNPGLPDTPTVREQGFNVAPTSFGGLFAPAGVPEGIKATLEKSCKSAKAQPNYLATAKRILLGTNLYADASAFGERLAKDISEKKELLKSLGYPK